MLDAAAQGEVRPGDWMRGMRRLVVLASVMVFFDVTFFAAIAPLLPEYVSEFGLSKAGAGILAGAYAAGTLLASLPAGLACHPGRAAADGDRRAAAARRLQRRLRLRPADRPARRGALHPGRRRGADLVGRPHLADHDRAAGAARLGDRHRPRRRGCRRPGRAGLRGARGRDRHRDRVRRGPGRRPGAGGIRVAPAGGRGRRAPGPERGGGARCSAGRSSARPPSSRRRR